jgi:hypothetical protein
LRLLENLKNNKLPKVLKILFMILLHKIITLAPHYRKFLLKSYSKKIAHLNVSDRLANEIKGKGITCHIVREIGSIQFEEKSCYSHLFPLSPRIITNRGYIRLSDIRSNTDNSKKLAIILYTRVVNCFYHALLSLITDTTYT